MYINLKKTLRDIERRLPEEREPTQEELRRAYDTVLRLRSQVLAVLRDREDFEGAQGADGALHAAFQKAAELGALPHFQKALVVIHIATPRGSDNTKVWDTSNRARSSSTT